jgi:hypothetical protein
MKNVILFLTIILISSCSGKNNKKKTPIWSEYQKRQYFEDSIANRMYNGEYGEGDSLNDFALFSKYMFSNIKAINIGDPYIYAFEEPYIDTYKKLPFNDWFRITVNPCFRIPYCLIIEKRGKSSYLTCKMTDGYGGYYSGKLSFSLTQKFSDTLYDDIRKQLLAVDFWSLGPEPIDGCDGETWTFEAIHNGKYNLIERWVPQKYGSSRTRKLAELGLNLRDTSKLFVILPLIDSITPINLLRQKLN